MDRKRAALSLDYMLKYVGETALFGAFDYEQRLVQSWSSVEKG